MTLAYMKKRFNETFWDNSIEVKLTLAMRDFKGPTTRTELTYRLKKNFKPKASRLRAPREAPNISLKRHRLENVVSFNIINHSKTYFFCFKK